MAPKRKRGAAAPKKAAKAKAVEQEPAQPEPAQPKGLSAEQKVNRDRLIARVQAAKVKGALLVIERACPLLGQQEGTQGNFRTCSLA